MHGELRIVDDVAEAFAELTINAYDNRVSDFFSIALSGGPTARRCYEVLAERSVGRIDWMKVDIYWGDERCVPPDSPDSNERLVREALLERVAGANQIIPMRCDEGADSYHLKVGRLDAFDLVHLGMGPDGHTASLFPNSPALHADPGRFVALNHDPSGFNPLERITLTYAGIARSRQVVFTVSGEKKRETMQRIVAGDDLPAQHIDVPNQVWLVDEDAAP